MLVFSSEISRLLQTLLKKEKKEQKVSWLCDVVCYESKCSNELGGLGWCSSSSIEIFIATSIS